MSVEALNETTRPQEYARARKVMESCDWQSDRLDIDVYSVSEDVVIATMIHYADCENHSLREALLSAKSLIEQTCGLVRGVTSCEFFKGCQDCKEDLADIRKDVSAEVEKIDKALEGK